MTGLVEDLPWRSMSPQALEELTYAIVEEMGAASVAWRSSGDSINAPDGGRDIEAVFNRPTPDDDIDREVWWLECKRRDGSVSPTDFKESVLNSTAHVDVAALIIVTNGHFSNPTRDWVVKHNEAKRGPVVKLWDQRRLQSLVEKYPSAAARTLDSLLDFEQKIQFLSGYFFERTRNLAELELREAWERRDEIEYVPFLVAASYSDICSNRIQERPWMSLLSDGLDLLEALLMCIHNLVGKVMVGHPVVNEKVVETAGYVLTTAATSLPSEVVAAVLDDPWSFKKEPKKTPSAILELLVQPVKAGAAGRLQQRCADDCARYHMSSDDDDKELFWKKYREPTAINEKAMTLCIVNYEVPCAVGLEVSRDIDCPLSSDVYLSDNQRYVDMIGRVIRFRIENPDGQFLKYSNIDPGLAATMLPDIFAKPFYDSPDK